MADISFYTEQARSIIDEPGQAEKLLTAISNYNNRGRSIVASSESRRDRQRFIEQQKEELEKRVEEEEERLQSKKDPASVLRAENFDSQRRMLDHVTVEGNQVRFNLIPVQGATTSTKMKSLYSHFNISPDSKRFRNLLQALYPLGIVNYIDDINQAPQAAAQTPDFQVMLFSQKFELPSPFSQRFLKDPRGAKRHAHAIYLRKLAQAEFRQQHGFDFDDINRWMKSHGVKDREKYRHQKHGEYAALWRRNDLNEIAARAAKDLPYLQYAYLLPFDLAKEQMRAGRGSLDDRFRNAFSLMHPRKHYLGLAFSGLDRHLRLFTLASNSLGMRLHISSQQLAKLRGLGLPVDAADIIETQKHYADGVTGLVPSRSKDDRHQTTIKGLQVYRGSPSREQVAVARDIENQSPTEDSSYIGRLHNNRAHSIFFFGYDSAALACAYMQRELDNERRVLSPFIFQKAPGVMLERKLIQQGMVISKITEEVKGGLNRGELEMVMMKNAVQQGYDSLTTDFSRAKRDASQICMPAQYLFKEI